MTAEEWFKTEEYMYLTRLKQISRAEKPRIWDSLNNGKWPDDLGVPPEGWNPQETHPISRALMLSIEIGCGKKALLRYCHKKEFGVTDQMFDDWWDSREETEKLVEYLEKKKPQRLGEQCTTKYGKGGNLPIVCKLFSFFRSLFIKKV